MTVSARHPDRLAKAKELLERRWVECINQDTHLYKVRSETDGRHAYTVRLGAPSACECADHFYRGLICKHILAAYLLAQTERSHGLQAQRN